MCTETDLEFRQIEPGKPEMFERGPTILLEVAAVGDRADPKSFVFKRGWMLSELLVTDTISKTYPALSTHRRCKLAGIDNLVWR